MSRPWNFLILLLSCHLATAYKILLLPTPFQSHLNYFIPLGEGLVEGGHKVHMILSSGSGGIDKIKQKGIHTLLYRPPDGVCQLATDAFHKDVSDAMLANPDVQALAAVVAPAVSRECDNFLGDDDVMKAASKLNFDLAIVDGLFFARCLYLFPVKLGVPYVTLTTFQEVWPARIPALPSFVPFHYAEFSEKMTFVERLGNTLINIIWILNSRTSPPLSPPIRDKYTDVLARVNFDELILDSKLWFFNSDIMLDYPKPLMPNVVHIGGMSPRPGKPLEPDLQSFMDSHTEGVVVVSFGSVIHDIPDDINQKLLLAFRDLPWAILWRNKDVSGLDLSPNIKAMSWLPQNDVLAHPNTKAFVTHCGNNGQFEALYHKVPMVGFPIFADQPYNRRRIENKGYGVGMDLRTFTSDTLSKTIRKVIEDPSYKQQITQGSDIFRDRKQTPKEVAVSWVEHVIKYGGGHLRSHALSMPWYEYLMLDIALATLLFIYTLYRLTKAFLFCLLNKITSLLLDQSNRRNEDKQKLS